MGLGFRGSEFVSLGFGFVSRVCDFGVWGLACVLESVIPPSQPPCNGSQHAAIVPLE